jgi:hypothetical protein
MGRAGLTVLVLAAVLAVGGIGQPAPNARSLVRGNLLKEWRDLDLYPDLDFNTGKPAAALTTGAMHCLTALDLYTRSGQTDRMYNSALALEELVLGNQPAAPLYLAIPQSDMLGLLVPMEIGISKDNELLDVFDIAQKAIAAVDLVRLKKKVGQPVAAKNLPRALYGLLNTQSGALQDYVKAVANARQAAQRLKDAQDNETGKKGDLDAAKAAAASKQKELQPYLDKATEAKKRQTEAADEETKATDAAARKEAKAKLAEATASLKNLQNDPKFVQLKKESAAADQKVSRAEAELPQATAAVDSARQPAKDRAEDLRKARPPAEKARNLMEVYRICYALDADKLFKFVTDRL